MFHLNKCMVSKNVYYTCKNCIDTESYTEPSARGPFQRRNFENFTIFRFRVLSGKGISKNASNQCLF